MAAPWPRYEGRQALGRMMHGQDVLTGIPATDLTTTTMGITKLSVYEDDYFNDWHGRFYLGPQADNDFEITAFDQETEPGLNPGKIAFKPAMSAAVVVTDYFEAYPEWSPAEMNDAINLALSSIAEAAPQDKRDESITVVSSATWEYEIPAGFVNIRTVMMESGTAGRFSPSLDTIDRKYWRILPGSPPKLWFDNNLASLTTGRRLRLIGQQAPPLLTKDSDLCSVDQAYVLYQAKANLHFTRVLDANDDQYRLMILAQARANEERQGLVAAAVGERVAF
jgi:hypothetical protein